MNAQIIALSNQKGGVTKSTTCVNLGIGLAKAGKKVLMIDNDPQASLSISLGYQQPDKLPVTLTDMMGKVLTDQPIVPGEGILHHPEGVDLMPANIELSGMEVSLVNAMSRETILRQYLDTVRRQYTHILIDCQPSLGMLTISFCRPLAGCGGRSTPSSRLTASCWLWWITGPILPRRSALCCGRPMEVRLRFLQRKSPIPSGRRRPARWERAFMPMTLQARWRRHTKI